MTKVKDIIIATKSNMSDYYINTIKQRIAGPSNMGSAYEMDFNSLELALINAKWLEIQHESVSEGCRVFKTSLPGFFGLISIEDVEENAVLYAIDPKSTGKIGIGIIGVKGKKINETYMISGYHNGIEVMFTFHPGEPIKPSEVSADSIPHGTVLSKQQAISMGFNLIKVLNSPPC